MKILKCDEHGKEYWHTVFEEGKWYTGEYEPRRSDQSFRINGYKHVTYWAIDEDEYKRKLSPSYFAIVFYSPEEEREQSINDLLNIS